MALEALLRETEISCNEMFSFKVFEILAFTCKSETLNSHVLLILTISSKSNNWEAQQ